MLSFVACGILVLVEDIGSALLFFLTLALIVASGLATAVLQVRCSPEEAMFTRFCSPTTAHDVLVLISPL